MINRSLVQTIADASNIVPPTNDEYSIDMFLQDFPVFSKKEDDAIVSLIPEHMLEQFIEMGKDTVVKGKWGKQWRYGMGLYVAHFSTMYLKNYIPEDKLEKNTIDNAQASGSISGTVSSASLGDQSISYDNSAITSGFERWGTWNSTQYGQQYITLAQMYNKGGMFIP